MRLRVVGVAISLVAIGAVVWWAARQPPPELPGSTPQFVALVAAIGVYGVATALRAERWLLLLERSAARPSRSDAYGLTVVGFMGNNVLPVRGGDALRVYLMAPRAGASARTVIGTLVAERLLDAATLLLLFAVLAYGVLRGIDAPSGAAFGLAGATLVVLTALAALALRIGGKSDRGRRLIAFLEPMSIATRDLRGRHGAGMAAITVAIWAVEAATYWLVGEATGLDMHPVEALYLIALASVFVLIPSGPGYAGTLDGAVLLGVKAIGAGGSEAVSYLVALRFVLLVPITLAGLLVLLLRYGWRPRPGAAGAEAGAR